MDQEQAQARRGEISHAYHLLTIALNACLIAKRHAINAHACPELHRRIDAAAAAAADSMQLAELQIAPLEIEPCF